MPKPDSATSPDAPSVLLVGARTARQGTGPFIAAAFAAAGARVSAIVGTRDATVDGARASLREELGIDCAGYTDLERALAQEQPDVVALCSPWRFHAAQLQQVAQAGCHCLCEKPLLWPDEGGLGEAVLEAFAGRGLLLQVVAQWPCTLAAFDRLHPGRASIPSSLRMRLSPISIGADMITDSAPHFLSLLDALWGPGVCESVTIDHRREDELYLQCGYRHAEGTGRAQLQLLTCVERPRPAWYEIDGLRANRRVDLPDYRQFFEHDGRQVPVPDPLQQVVAHFLHCLRTGAATDTAGLRSALRNLQRLDAAWPH